MKIPKADFASLALNLIRAKDALESAERDIERAINRRDSAQKEIGATEIKLANAADDVNPDELVVGNEEQGFWIVRVQPKSVGRVAVTAVRVQAHVTPSSRKIAAQ